MRSYHRLGSLFGIEIGIHVSWYVVFVLLAYSLATGFFAEQLKGQSTLVYASLGVAASFFLFLSVLFHELAHSLVARSFRMRIDRVYLFFFGGVSQIDEAHMSPKSEFLMALAGPLLSLVLGVLVGWFAPVIIDPALRALAVYLSRVNILVGIFNLLPGFPLDGGRVLRSVLWWKTGRFDVATWYASRSGKWFGAGLAILGLFAAMFGDLSGLWVAVVGAFLFVIAESSFQQMLLKQSLSGKPVSLVIDSSHPSVPSGTTVEDLVQRFFLHLPNEYLPVLDGRRFVGIVQLSRVVKVQPAVRHALIVDEIMVREDKIPVLSPQDSLYGSLELMAKSGLDILPVTRGKDFLGVVTRQSLVHFLRAKALEMGASEHLDQPQGAENDAKVGTTIPPKKSGSKNRPVKVVKDAPGNSQARPSRRPR